MKSVIHKTINNFISQNIYIREIRLGQKEIRKIFSPDFLRKDTHMNKARKLSKVQNPGTDNTINLRYVDYDDNSNNMALLM